MNRDQKGAVIAEIAADIESSDAILAVDYRGITVAQAAELRASLRDAGTRFRVVKNSLTERAADQAGLEGLKPLLTGPTALAFVKGDAAAAAKAIADHARTTQLLPFKGGLMGSEALGAEQVVAISKLPSREALYGQLVGVVASPVSGLVRTLGALVGGLAVALGQVRAKKESGEVPAGEAPTPTAEEPAGDETPAPAAEGAGDGAPAEEQAEPEAQESGDTTSTEAAPAVEEPEAPVAQAQADDKDDADESADQAAPADTKED